MFKKEQSTMNPAKSTKKHTSKKTQELTRETMPLTRIRLKQYLRRFLNYRVPDRHICGHHASPFDYLWHTYSCDLLSEINRQKLHPNPPFRYKQLAGGDCIVWANRGGGKTQLAAVAALLEGMFKKKCQTLILAGSLDQSGRMYDYLCEFIEAGKYKPFIKGRMLSESCRFTNGTTVEALSQSARSVRGRHVNKLRCDEIELFDEDVLNAAKFVTQSTNGHVAAMEMFSTLHRPYGLMQKIIENAAQNNTPVFQWCMWEVIERCTSDRSCSRCPLNRDCHGKARRANGYLKIDDCIAQMRRSSRTGFESEMLCLRPSLENAVFDEFDPAVHVRPVSYDPILPLYRAMDFGFTNPFVCLWLQVDANGMVRVIDEYIQNRRRIVEHGKVVIAHTPCDESQVRMTCCDPAGAQHNGVSGTSEVRELTNMGMRLKYRHSEILEGIEHIRAHLRAGDGSHRLVIDPRCRKLIEAMRCYHYPNAQLLSELPKKDGKNDHPIDALRYFFVNYKSKSTKPSNRY